MMKPVVLILFLLSCFKIEVFSQFVISGTVTDASTGQPVPGVNLIISKTSFGTYTDENGNYSFENLPSSNYTIEISHLNYQSQIFKIELLQAVKDLNFKLQPKNLQLSDVFVTATRSEKQMHEIPASISNLGSENIQSYPVLNLDDVLHTIPGMNIDRDFGIFSKNSNLTMRGLNASYRSLILIDGLPINKTDGGGINWNRINPDNIERIEVVKGSGSALYGGNAMSGIVNVITHKPEKSLQGRIKTFAGSYNTWGSSVLLEGSKINNFKGMYWSLNGFYRKGDGYIVVSDTLRTPNDVNTYLTEYNTGIKLGYQWSLQNQLETEYNFYDDKRGTGIKIHVPDGGYNKYTTHSCRVSYTGATKKTRIFINAFYQNEYYQSQNESIKKKTGKYTLYHTLSQRVDAGLWMSLTRPVGIDQILTYGIDIKQGSVDAEDNYKTSSDILSNQGKIRFYAAFVQHEWNILNKKLKIISGLRFDAAQFLDGEFRIEEPTSFSQFMTKYPAVFRDTTWTDISPKIAVLYPFLETSKIYISYAKGFRSPILDDMCTNRNITKGFKRANPGLKPENLHNFEFGYSLQDFHKFNFEQAFYYSMGKDFQYFISTGDSVDTGGDNLKPVLQRQNVSRVEVLGTEMNLSYTATKNLQVNVCYAYNHSVIKEFINPYLPNISLNGKFLMEVPEHLLFGSLQWKSTWFNCMVIYNYRSRQWGDDENLTHTNPRNTFDGQVSTQWKDQYYLSLSVQDLFNQQFTDSKGQLSPGRYFMMNLVYKF